MNTLAKTILFLCLSCYAHFPLAQNYCDYSDCLFWEQQAEMISEDLDVKFADNVWTIDELSNQPPFDVCGHPLGWQCTDLFMDIYYPDLAPGEIRPLIVLIHGGGFYTGNRNTLTPFAIDLAQRGYVTANVDYRKCKRNNCLAVLNGLASICNISWNSDAAQSMYVGTLDVLTATQFLIDNANAYHIDTDNIILLGNSAGAVISLEAPYWDQAEVEAQFPGFDNTWGQLPIVPQIKGVVSVSGGVHDMSILEASKDVDVFMVHGTCDPTVIYDVGGGYGCNSFPDFYGSVPIAEYLHAIDRNHQLFTGLYMDHDATTQLDLWYPEMLNFLRRSVLCDEAIQRHVVVEYSPASQDCNQVSRTPAALPTQNLMSGFECSPSNTHTIQSNEVEISIFPNPASNFVELTNSGKTPFDFKVLDVTGKTVHSGVLDNTLQISIANWSKGVYFIHGTNGQSAFSHKLFYVY